MNSEPASYRENSALNDKDPSRLFERKPDEEYIREWSERLSQKPLDDEPLEKIYVMIFRLQEEWLALPLASFKQVCRLRPVHRIPHLGGPVFQGLVNLNGELELAAALDALLHIERPLQSARPTLARTFMLAIEKKGERWVFPIDEMDGIYNLNRSKVENVPATALQSPDNFFKGIVEIGGRSIGLLDEDLLFSGLRRCLESPIG